MAQRAFEEQNHGQTVRGTVYVPEVDGRVPTVVLVHGFTGNRFETGFLFVKLGRALADRGIAAVTFDCRGSGESDGTFDDMLVTGELSDLLAISQWATHQPFADRSRMGLLGFSLGGLLAGCAVARTGVYQSLALLAPTTVDNLCRFAGDTVSTPATPITVGPHRLHPAFFDDLRTLDPLSDVTHHEGRTLLLQGTADEAVKPDVSQQFVDTLQRASRLVDHRLIRDANHGWATPEHQQRVIDEVTDFFARTLT